jgi:hypothetical protein
MGMRYVHFVSEPMRSKARTAMLSLVVVLVCALLFSVLAYHQVSDRVTEEDRLFIPKYIGDQLLSTVRSQMTYGNELDFILHVQRSVLAVAPGNEEIPFNTEREPKDLYLAKSGLCFDRSRVIEKILRYAGFETRHISIYSTKGISTPLKALMTPGVSSHAVTEVLTSRGWLVIDSNARWISVDSNGNPYSIKAVQSDIGAASILWAEPLPSVIYKEGFLFIYGLYSRHGRFYPPHDFIPDVNYRELIQNWR